MPVALALALAIAAPGFAEWEQWRGPEGAGVAPHARFLPESWEPDGANIRWQTPIRGEGVSSPVVSGGRVFVTTAYESPTLRRWRSVCITAAMTLAALFLVLFVVRLWRRRGTATRTGRWDRLAVGVISILFVVAAAYMTLRPDEFFELSNPGRAYRLAGGIALIGVAAAIGWFERRSAMRLAGAALLILGMALFLFFMPRSSYGPTPLSKSLPFIAPTLGIVLWYAIGFARARGRAVLETGRGGSSLLLATLLALTAALFYLPINVLNGLDRVVVSLDAESGEIVWERTVFTSPPEKKWSTSSYATPTPATDGELVFAYFGHGMAALDFDGRVVWSERFPDYAHSTRYGAAASPILHGDALILGREQELNSPETLTWLSAWDKSTGRRLWRKEVPDLHDSYTTPLLFRAGSGAQLLIASWRTMASHDADSGERLWSVEYTMQQIVASLATAGDLVALSGGAHGDLFIYMYRLSGEGSQTEVETLWRTSKGVSVISSPVIYDGKLFTVTVPGIMTAYAAETGRQLWKKRLKGEHYASLVAGDGKVYAVNTEGVVTVVSAAELEVLATNELDDIVYSSPAIADGCLLIRTATSLICVEGDTRQAEMPTPSTPS